MANPPLCVCGHGKDAHEHYRRGTDCGMCGAAVCPRFRPTSGVAGSTARPLVALPVPSSRRVGARVLGH